MLTCTHREVRLENFHAIHARIDHILVPTKIITVKTKVITAAEPHEEQCVNRYLREQCLIGYLPSSRVSTKGLSVNRLTAAPEDYTRGPVHPLFIPRKEKLVHRNQYQYPRKGKPFPILVRAIQANGKIQIAN